MGIDANVANSDFDYRHRLLVDAGRLSLLVSYTDLTKVILDALGDVRLKVRVEEYTPSWTLCFSFEKEPEYLLEVRLIQADYMVKHLGDNEQLYNKSSVDVIKRDWLSRVDQTSFSFRHACERLNWPKKRWNHWCERVKTIWSKPVALIYGIYVYPCCKQIFGGKYAKHWPRWCTFWNVYRGEQRIVARCLSNERELWWRSRITSLILVSIGHCGVKLILSWRKSKKILSSSIRRKTIYSK